MLPNVVNAYNSTTHKSTGCAPNQVNSLEKIQKLDENFMGKNSCKKL